MKLYILGMIIFLESGIDEKSGKVFYKECLDCVIEEIVLVDKVGFDYYGIGEYYRLDYVVLSF